MAETATAPVATLEAALARGFDLLERAPALAEAQAGEILAVMPGQPDALLLHARALAALDRTEAAIAALRELVRRHSDFGEAWRSLGELHLLAGQDADADAAFAQQIRASTRDPQLRAAAVALCDQDLPTAEALLRRRLKDRPTDVAAIRMLAELAGRLGRNADARNLLERALELAPGFAAARFNLATVLYRQNGFAEAIAELDRLLDADPAHPAYRNLKAAALARLGDFDQALEHFEHVLSRRPDQPKIWMSYGHALKTVGRQADSVAAYRRAIAGDPGLGEAWWSLANLKTVRLDEADIAAMEAGLQGEVDADGQVHFHFALGKAHEDAGRAAEAFGHYDQGARLRRLTLPYDAEERTRRVERAKALFTPAFFAERAGKGCAAPDPIFILGMPRSGSTLLEQILASHPAVEGTQELPDIPVLASRIAAEAGGDYLAGLAALDGERLRALGEDYLQRAAAQRRTDRPFFIDKMPNNWRHIGLIHLILPRARIIDARRHPLACGFSNFKQHFARGQAFSYGLEDMGRYYADYVALTAHFDEVLPGRVHRVFYEAMVQDTESEVRRLLDALELPFDPACLRFHETRRSVRTPSSEQVRKPIFREGLDQWRMFEPWLDPLKTALGPALETYPFPTDAAAQHTGA